MTNVKNLNLDDARTSFESRVLSGRDRGLECRRVFDIAALDSFAGVVVVTIPADIYSMNTSFFLGLFGDSVRALGKEGFIQKYRFECADVHSETITEGIDRALKESTIFDDRKLA